MSYWAVILSDDARVILEALKILLVCFKFMLPASEHWSVGLPHCVGELLFPIELKHGSIDGLQHSNNVLVTLYGLIFYIPYQIGENTLGTLSMNNCERPFQVLFQNLISVNELFILASMIIFWTIVRAVSPVLKSGYVGAYIVGFEIFLTEYFPSLPFFWNLIPQM